MSIRGAEMPLVHLTHGGEARLNGAVKEELIDGDASGVVKDEPVDEKQDVVDDNMYNFHQY
jgi:hypothetical protein